MKPIFKEKNIALIGASANPEKYGYKIFKSLLENGYHVFGVHPVLEEIIGEKIYKKISQVPQKIDLVITVVNPKVTENIIEEMHTLGLKDIWMQPGSDSDIAVEKAKSYGINVVRACFMVENNIW